MGLLKVLRPDAFDKVTSKVNGVGGGDEGDNAGGAVSIKLGGRGGEDEEGVSG